MRAQRLVVPVVAGIAVFGTVSAFAASLNLTSDDLASNEVPVNACSADAVNAAYKTAYTAGSGYTVTDVTLTSPTACLGQLVKVTLTGPTGAVLFSSPVAGTTLATATQDLPVSGTVKALDVSSIAVVIAGPAA